MDFPKQQPGDDTRIRVHFMDQATGQTIGITDLAPEQLPASFAVPTTFTIGAQEWSVQEALPATAAEFTRTRQLTLRLHKIEYLDPQAIRYSLPTIAAELPALSDQALFQDFTLSIFDDDWRQNEFLPASAYPRIAHETAAIKHIWDQHSATAADGFHSFQQLHVRETIGAPQLALDFAQLQGVLRPQRLGALALHDQPGFVRHGFALQTAAATYYGLLDGPNTVTHLCLDGINEDALPAVQAVNTAFNLVFVVWYHAQVVGPAA